MSKIILNKPEILFEHTVIFFEHAVCKWVIYHNNIIVNLILSGHFYIKNLQNQSVRFNNVFGGAVLNITRTLYIHYHIHFVKGRMNYVKECYKAILIGI